MDNDFTGIFPNVLLLIILAVVFNYGLVINWNHDTLYNE